MKNIRIVVLGLLLALGCNRTDSPQKLANSQTARVPDTLVYQEKTISKQYGNCEKGEGCVSVVFTYPEIVSTRYSPMLDSIRQMIQKQVFKPAFGISAQQKSVLPQSVDEVAKLFYSEMRQLQQSEKSYASTWEVERKVRVLTNRPPLLTLEVSELTYTGGAHPNHFTKYINIDLRTGKRITLNELFSPEALKKLEKLAEKRFREDRKFSKKQSWSELGFFFENGEFHLNDNFKIDSDGITFLFNPYEVASYAFGSIELKIPLSDIRPLLKTSDYFPQ
jgi:hypothetical protein